MYRCMDKEMRQHIHSKEKRTCLWDPLMVKEFQQPGNTLQGFGQT